MTEHASQIAPCPRKAAGRGRRPAKARSLLAAGCLLPAAFCLLPSGNAGAQARIVSLRPETGPTRGGTTVILEVEGGVTLGPMAVQFGGRAAGTVRRLGWSVLEAVTPAGDPGPVPVRVVNELWGTSTAPAVFTYVPPPPRLLRLEPPAAPVGSGELVLTLEGEYFAVTSSVRFGEATVPTVFAGPRRLQARVPAPLLAGAGVVAVLVNDGAVGGGRSNVMSFSVVNPAPQVTGLDAPPLKTGGSATAFSVRGRGFRPDSLIRVAGTSLATRYLTDEALSAVMPAELLAKPGSLPVEVVTPGPGGGTSNSTGLTVLPPFPGRFLVFTSNRRGGRNHLYLLDRETGRLDPLEEANSPNAGDAYPSISADGRFIAFHSDRHRAQHDVFLFDRETRTLDPLPELNHPTAFDGFPHLSADGRFIVFESDRLNGRPKIFFFDRQTRTLSEVGQANETAADDGLAAISN